MGKISQEEASNRILKHYDNNAKLISIYKNKRSNVLVKCLLCGHQWSVYAQNIINKNSIKKGKCPNCLFGERQVVFRKKCETCGKELERTSNQIKRNKSGYFYCSPQCGNIHKNIMRHQSEDWLNNSQNYRLKAFNLYEHKCDICGWDEDKRILEVHHIDENRENNTPKNLIILCPNCHKYLTLHIYTLKELRMMKIKGEDNNGKLL